MAAFIEWLKGKKTYIIAVAIVVLGVLQGFGIFTLPEWVWPILGGLGLTTLRAGVNTIADSVKQE